MKTAIIIADGIKQVMLTPENDSEKMALKMITENDDITVEFKTGTLFDKAPRSALGYIIQKSNGDYLRAYESEDSLMLVLKPKAK